MTITPTDLRAALFELTPAQQAAVESLAFGATHAEAVKAANVSRESVSRWAGHNPGVRAALNLLLYTMADQQADAVRRIRGRALAVVEEKLDGADLSTALAVLRVVPATPKNIGPTEAAPVLDSEIRRT
ncbi:MAG: hypothetical protein ACLPR9_10260 [Acidimicrobiales bacterium]